MKARYTDEALSRVLGEHAAGNLVRGGSVGWAPVCYHRRAFARGYLWNGYGRGCVNQAAFNEPCIVAAKGKASSVATWFDWHYLRDMTPEDLLAGIEERK